MVCVCVWYIAQIRNTELTTSRENPEQRCACVFDAHSLTYVRFCFARFSTLFHFSVLVKSAKCDVSYCSLLLISFLLFYNSLDIIIIIIIILLLFTAIDLSLGGCSPYTSIQSK